MSYHDLARTAIPGLVLAAMLLVAHAGAASDGPEPPCGEGPRPAYADPGAAPNVESWRGGDLGAGWQPPACVGWGAPGFDVLVALAGSFTAPGTMQDMLGRLAAVSRMTAIRYWSVTDQAWKPLFTSASALSGPDVGLRRPDFTAAELTPGSTVYVAQSDNRSSGEVVYRFTIRERSAERVVVETENVTAVRSLFVTLFEPGELQSTYFLERKPRDVWTYYSLSRTSAAANWLARRGSVASYINRAVALFRHVAGIPTDQEPPAARS